MCSCKVKSVLGTFYIPYTAWKSNFKKLLLNKLFPTINSLEDIEGSSSPWPQWEQIILKQAIIPIPPSTKNPRQNGCRVWNRGSGKIVHNWKKQSFLNGKSKFRKYFWLLIPPQNNWLEIIFEFCCPPSQKKERRKKCWLKMKNCLKLG